MHVEVPEFTKCCFCFPLRRGLLFWGYLRLIWCLLYLVALLTINYLLHVEDILLVVLFIICLIETSFNLVFIIGAHKKSYKLLRVFYIFGLTVLGLSVGMFVLLISLQLYMVFSHKYPSSIPPTHIVEKIVEECALFFVNVVLQVYLLFLIRSAMTKFKNGCKFQFTNNAAEAECKMADSEKTICI